MKIASETKFCAGLYYNAEELKIWEIQNKWNNNMILWLPVNLTYMAYVLENYFIAMLIFIII